MMTAKIKRRPYRHPGYNLRMSTSIHTVTNQRLGIYLALMSLVALLLPAGADAHRGHETWTDVVWADSHFEITHQIHVADALAVLELMETSAAVDSMEGLALLALYVESNFRIADQSEQPQLETIGAELDDDFLYVFQEWRTDLPSAVPAFESTILSDVASGVVSVVHYEAPGVNETLNLSASTSNTQIPHRSADWLIAL